MTQLHLESLDNFQKSNKWNNSIGDVIFFPIIITKIHKITIKNKNIVFFEAF